MPIKAEPISYRFSQVRLPRLTQASINCTYACNMACPGCNRGAFLKPPIAPAMTLEQVQGFLDEARSLRAPLRKLKITGGEATFHPQFQEIVAAAVAFARTVRCSVSVRTNGHHPKSQQAIAEALRRFPRLSVKDSSKHAGPVTFADRHTSMFVSPLDVGLPWPFPCKMMGGWGCGISVDSLGYTICACGGTIDSILGTSVRVSRLKQLTVPCVAREQIKALCSHCGSGMYYSGLMRLPVMHGSPVSRTWARAFQRLEQSQGGQP
jgi:hypothetical protein